MPKENSVPNGYIKKERSLLVALLALVVGFLGGAAFGVYKSVPKAPIRTPVPPRQMAQEPGLSREETRQIEDLELRTSLHPEDAEAWTRLGNAYFDAHQHAKAIDAYKRSLNLEPGDPNVWTDLGVMYRRNGQPEKAVESFDRASAADPSHDPSRLNKGIVLLHDLNDTEGAVEAWEGLAEVNPMAKAPGGQRPLSEMLEALKASLDRQESGGSGAP